MVGELKYERLFKKISIVIRTYNEEKHIKSVLESIYSQDYKNFEVIIVDSQSTDNTLKICSSYPCNIVNIKKSRFNYSYASNIGAANSSGDIICYLSGHSVIKKNDYLSYAASLFRDNSIGGVYGEVIALSDGSIIEKLFNGIGYIKSLLKGIVYETKIHPGILSCSNAMLRKDIWEKHKFKEELGAGGEDVEMANCILDDGYKIIKAPKLLVRHSHGSNIKAFIKEFKAWRLMYEDVLNYINK